MNSGNNGTNEESLQISRRNLLRAGAGAATLGTASTVAPNSPVGRARAIAPIVIGGAIVAGAVLGYLVHEGVDYVTGDDKVGSYTGDEEGDILHQSLYDQAREVEAKDDTVITVLSNRVEDSRNIAWVKGKRAAIKELNAGSSQTAASQAGQDAINAYYATVQKNLLNHFTEQANRLGTMAALIADSPNLSAGLTDYIDTVGASEELAGLVGQYGAGTSYERTMTLFDGTDFTYKVFKLQEEMTNQTEPLDPFNPAQHQGYFEIPPVDTGTTQQFYMMGDWKTLWTDLVNARDQMITNISSFVSDLYANYTRGELDPADYLDPITLANELSTDYESTGYHAYAAAEAAVMGMPSTRRAAMTIELTVSGITTRGTIWTDWKPEGGSGFETGKTYDPANTAKDVFLSYEYAGPEYIDGADVFYQDGGDWTQDGNATDQSSYNTTVSEYGDSDVLQVGFQQLDEPFVIKEATDTETGEAVTSVEVQSDNYQTSDVSVTEKELEQLLELRQELRESETSIFGGLGVNIDDFAFGGLPGEAVVLGIIAVAAAYLRD